MVLPVNKKADCWKPQIEMYENPTHVINSPFHLVGQHVVHRGHHLDGHIDQSFTEHEANMCVRLREEGF